MASVHEHFSRQFHKWEKRGRGWQVFEQPVHLEPPFSPFVLRAMTDTPAVDDGSRPSFLGSLFRKVVAPPEPPPQVEDEPEEDAEPTPLIREPLVELQIALPAELNCSKDSLEQLFNALTLCKEPLAFELFGIHGKVVTQFAAASYDVPLLRRQLQAFFPEAQYKTCKDVLPET